MPPSRTFAIRLALLVLFGATSAVAQGRGGPAPRAQSASLVVTNAKIMTMDPTHPRAEALAVVGERIVAVGTVANIQSYVGPQTQTIDAHGRLVVPGFNDSHTHFASGSARLRTLDLYGISSLADVGRLVAARVQQAKPGEWIRGSGYDHSLWTTADRWPTRFDLDKVAPNNPVALTRASGHSVWANSLALKVSGITKDTPSPAAGEVQKDRVTGEPTGILLESASGLLKISRDTSLNAEQRRERARADLLAGLRFAAELGVTSLQSSSSLNELDLLRELKKADKLTARFTGWIPLGEAQSLADGGFRTGQGDDWVRVGFLKGFIDGTLGDGTAAMFEPFSDRAGFMGLPRMTPEQLDSAVMLADRLGFQVGVHAIGDKAVNLVLNAYEKAALRNGTRDMRHRIEHAQLIKPDDIARFGKLGVIPSMQPTHQTTDMRFAESRVGFERSKTSYAWRSLLDGGAMLAFGTDWSVEPLDPMRGVFSSVTRTNIQRMEPREGWFPEQKLTVWESIYYYTYGSAYAEHMENAKGSLVAGRAADFVITDKDLFTIATEQILTTKVDYTIVGGRIVWDRAANRYGNP